ncbi:MAG: hypothetical protein GXW99_12425 [Clostridiales bacterium]|nr:hypothetical protein [Clostridiales bacterium]
MISAIVYTSETGFTRQYAAMLSEETGLPAYSLDRVPEPRGGREIIYMGWLAARGIAGYPAAAARYKVRCVCQVGLDAPTAHSLERTRKWHNIDPEIPLFALQGGLDINKLHGAYRLMMQAWRKKTIAQLEKEKPLDEQQRFLYNAARFGASCVKRDNLQDIIAWYHTVE